MGSPVAAPDPGKNWHPLAAKRPHKDIMGRIQGIMKREGYGAFILMLGGKCMLCNRLFFEICLYRQVFL
jgi:hypothetical protein